MSIKLDQTGSAAPYGSHSPPPYNPAVGYPPQGQQPYNMSDAPYGSSQPATVYVQQPVPVNVTVTMQPPPSSMGTAAPPNCPPGLEYLSLLDQLLIKQKVELLEAFTGFETNNKYNVLNAMGQPVYKAKEQTDCLTRQCCGPLRPFDLSIKDNFEREVIHLQRPLRCQSCYFFCCLQKLEVTAGASQEVLGTVHQKWSMIFPHFIVKDSVGNTVLQIKGPFCTYSICGDVEFKVLSADGDHEVGRISKQWSGLAREAFTDSDNFGVSFPADLDVRIKAVLLGAVFLIDFMFFEKSGNQENDGIGMGS